jgi:lipopolysaccharide heptosyltransferase I
MKPPPGVNRVLIVKLGALGDIVHAIPVAAALKRALPSVRIDWLVSPHHRAVLDLVPVVDRRIEMPDSRMFGVIRELRANRYDVALDLQGLIKSAFLARASGATRVIGFASRYTREPLSRLFYSETYDPGGVGMYHEGETHVVLTNLGLLEPLGIERAAHAPQFPIEVPASAIAARVVESTGGRYAILNVGAAWPNKRWMPSRFGAVASSLFARYGLRSVVFWGPGEEALARVAAEASSGAATLLPETSIADTAALARGASLFVSGDTGPAHLAAAVGTPIVGIYGPTRPSRNGPWSPDDVTVSRANVCRCHHLRECRVKTMCLEDIEVDEVMAAIDRRLAGARRG